MTDAEMLGGLVADVEAVGDVLAASPDASVVHCPGWSVSDLVAHHGGVLRWAEAIARTGNPVFEQYSAPGSDELRSWYDVSARNFVATISRADRDRPCWTFGRQPGRLWFWTRRQALEAAVHRWDADRAVGVMVDVPPSLASVGMSEVVEVLFPRQVELGRTGPISAGLILRATDVERQWIVAASTNGREAIVEAPVSVLLLVLWRRVDLTDARIGFSGSADLRAELEAARMTP